MRVSLHEFIRGPSHNGTDGAWHVLEPAQPYVDNWHIEVLCAELEAQMAVHFLAPGEALPVIPSLNPITGTPIPWSQNVLMNVPPGTMKSLIVSVFLPAWVWLRKPSWRAIYASAADDVASRDSQKCRELIESEWYRERFRPTWRLADDQNAKMLYKNTETGFRQAVTVGRKITGARADALFVDDPLDASQAHVDSAALKAVLVWWDNAFANRVSNATTSTRTVIMQRLHELDLSGHLLMLSKPPEPGAPVPPGAFRHVCLPQEFEPGRGYDGDKRATKGELLFPARFPAEALAQELHRLRPTGYAGQHQQRPTDAAGNKFKREHWQFWRYDDGRNPVLRRSLGCNSNPARLLPPKQRFHSITASIDTNQVEGEDNDYCVITVIGRIHHDRFVLWRYRKQCTFTELEEAIKLVQKLFPGCRRKYIEMKANGPAVVNRLKSKIPGLIPIPNKITGAGKEARAAAATPMVESGNYYLPENAPWLDEWIDEFASFPKGAHDDQVDSISQLEAVWAEQSEGAGVAEALTEPW